MSNSDVKQKEVERKIKIERVEKILLTELRRNFLDTWGLPVSAEKINEELQKEMSRRQELQLKERFSHLSDSDLVLAAEVILPRHLSLKPSVTSQDLVAKSKKQK